MRADGPHEGRHNYFTLWKFIGQILILLSIKDKSYKISIKYPNTVIYVPMNRYISRTGPQKEPGTLKDKFLKFQL